MIESGVPIRSASRAFSVLRTINEFGSASLSEIARHERLPHPTAFRIMQTLVHEGLIERAPTGRRYHPTALVQSLSSGYDSSIVRKAAEPIISALTREIGWPVFLSERVGRRFVIRASTHHETTLTFFNWKCGCSFPVLGSVTGLIWLSRQTESCVRDLIRSEIDLDDGEGACDIDDLLATLNRVRADGFAVQTSRYEKNGRTASLSVPVFPDRSDTDVLTLTYFASSMSPQEAVRRYLEALQSTAASVAARISLPAPRAV